jgi:hypothetical protein
MDEEEITTPPGHYYRDDKYLVAGWELVSFLADFNFEEDSKWVL